MVKSYRKKRDVLSLKPAKSYIRDKAPNMKTEDVIMCYLVRVITHFMIY